MPIPVFKTSLILFASCSRRDPFLARGDPSLGQSEELAVPGRPGTVDELVTKVERREAQRPTSLGARGFKGAARGGRVTPPQRVLRKHSGASRRSIALARFARGLANLGRSGAARMLRLGCLTF